MTTINLRVAIDGSQVEAGTRRVTRSLEKIENRANRTAEAMDKLSGGPALVNRRPIGSGIPDDGFLQKSVFVPNGTGGKLRQSEFLQLAQASPSAGTSSASFGTALSLIKKGLDLLSALVLSADQRNVERFFIQGAIDRTDRRDFVTIADVESIVERVALDTGVSESELRKASSFVLQFSEIPFRRLEEFLRLGVDVSKVTFGNLLDSTSRLSKGFSDPGTVRHRMI